jgi:hypothetical protein
MKRILGITLLSLTLLTSCSKRARGLEDSPIDQLHIDHGAAQVIDMPNGFGNIAVKCDHHGHRVYATTQHAVTVVADLDCPSDWNTPGR